MHSGKSRAVQVLVILLLPPALLALALRLTATPAVVRWEYTRADFPPDPYGLTTAERIRLAEACLDYLLTGAGIERLAGIPLGSRPAFRPKELAHMEDVKRVLWALWGTGAASALLALGGTVALAVRPHTRRRAPAALLGGSLLTMGLVAAAGLLMLLGWPTFFTGFHEILFAPGSWTFSRSDTLLRLYPERFWQDLGGVLVGCILAGALLIAGGSFLWLRRTSRPH
ncbi:MAG: TIGR01906 family membrane protein [Chloroflexia bacterium]